MTTLTQIILVTAVLVALGAITLVFWLVRRSARSIKILKAGVDRIRQGDLDVRLPEIYPGELGDLAHGFNAMASSLSAKEAQLQAYAAELDTRVQQRTQALANSEAEMRSVWSAMTDVILVTDDHGQILRIAPTSPEPAYQVPPEYTGRSIQDLLPFEQAMVFVEKLHAAQDTRQLVQFEIPLQIDATTFWFSITITPMQEHTLLWVGRDITGRKKIEEELHRLNADLARSNAELEQFAYVASHDLQEPLRQIASYTRLLEKRYKNRLDADADEFIGYTVDSATRMQRLISDLLAYSRVSMHGKPFDLTDLNESLKQALFNLQITIEENQASITRDRLPVLKADATQMVQLFQNLVGNAIKFHSQEPPRIHISSSRVGDMWAFEVRDNGIGIDPRFSERIFILFQRLHDRSVYPGTGIGLAICKRIVERHQGKIWVESELGKGAAFYFTLPAV